MLGGNGRIGFALGLVAGLVLAVLLALALDSPQNAIDREVQNVSQPSEDDRTYRQKADEEENALTYWARRLVKIEDTSAQWVMMAFSIVAAVLLWQTLTATQKMANESRNIGRRQVRAYLAVENVTWDFGHDHIKVSWEIKNKGASQAKNVWIVSGWAGEIGEFDVAWLGEAGKIPVGAIPPGGGVAKDIATNDSEDPLQSLNLSEIEEIQNNKRGFWVYGRIRYDDAFGDPAETTFRYKLSFRNGRWSMDVCEAGNDMT